MALVAAVDSSTSACKVEVRNADTGALVASGRAPHPPTADLLEDDEELAVVERVGWLAWVPHASSDPHHLRLAPLRLTPDIPSLDDDQWEGLAGVLVDVLARFEGAFDPPMPYMFWWVQRPTDGRAWPGASAFMELVSPWRAQGVARFVAPGELGGGVLVNPVDPADVARRLRRVLVATADGVAHGDG